VHFRRRELEGERRRPQPICRPVSSDLVGPLGGEPEPGNRVSRLSRVATEFSVLEQVIARDASESLASRRDRDRYRVMPNSARCGGVQLPRGTGAIRNYSSYEPFRDALIVQFAPERDSVHSRERIPAE